MPFEFRLPDLGEGIEEAEVLQWQVARGDQVAAFQPLCQVESAKAAVELTAPVAGRIREVCVAQGGVARRGELLVVIDTESEPSGEWFGIVGRAPEPKAETTAEASGRARSQCRAAPFVRKLAKDLGVRLEDVAGSGPQGRVRASDVQASARRRRRRAAIASHSRAYAKRSRAHGRRPCATRRRSPRWTCSTPPTSTQARDALRPMAEAEGVKLNYLPFFVRAAIEALRAVPEANAMVEDDALLLKDEFNIGIATAVPGGLIVPVVKNAEQRSLLELAQEIDRVVTAARERRSTPADLSGGTFTITSFGGLPGSPLFATPILNYPEVAILGIGRIDWQPRVVDGQVVPRECVGISFTFDHRVLDGEGAGRFMSAFKQFVEQPLALLLRLR